FYYLSILLSDFFFFMFFFFSSRRRHTRSYGDWSSDVCSSDLEDNLRKLMLREPRGYPASNCNLILPPTDPKADAGFVIMEQVERSEERRVGKECRCRWGT